MTAPNIVNVVTITAKSAVQAVATTATDIISNAAGSGTVLKVNVLQVANVNGTASATITASIYRSSTEYKIAHAIPVVAASSLTIIDKSTAIYLEEGDSLRLTSGTAAYLHAVCSYEVLG
jgi:stress response protein SCP2